MEVKAVVQNGVHSVHVGHHLEETGELGQLQVSDVLACLDVIQEVLVQTFTIAGFQVKLGLMIDVDNHISKLVLQLTWLEVLESIHHRLVASFF